MMDLEKLREPFPAEDIEWRIGRSGKNAKGIWATALAYVNNRAIMNRLDEVCGVAGWENRFERWGDKGVLCAITIHNCGSPTCITKWDGAQETAIESVKGGLSDSMKRAAVQFGIGRYLYNLPEAWVETSETKIDGWIYATGKIKKDGKEETFTFYWKEPSLPYWALPGGEGKPPTFQRAEPEKKPAAKPATKPAATPYSRSIDKLSTLTSPKDIQDAVAKVKGSDKFSDQEKADFEEAAKKRLEDQMGYHSDAAKKIQADIGKIAQFKKDACDNPEITARCSSEIGKIGQWYMDHTGEFTEAQRNQIADHVRTALDALEPAHAG